MAKKVWLQSDSDWPLDFEADAFSFVAPISPLATYLPSAFGGTDGDTSGEFFGFLGDDGDLPSATSLTQSTSELVSFAGSGIVFSNTYTSNVTAAYKNDILAAEKDLASHWTNAVTIKVTFDAQTKGTNGFLASNSFNLLEGISYASLKAALVAHASSADAQAAIASLPATDPSGGVGWSLPIAYARMLGLTSVALTTDDTVVLNTSYNWTYGQDVTSAVEHELSEGGMGRIGALGKSTDSGGHVLWSAMDLFRYSAPGVRDFTDGQDGKAAYFSAGGSQLLLQFNNQYGGATQVNGGDTADYNVLDAFGTGSPGSSLTLNSTDITNMNVLGWALAATAPVDHAPVITSNGGGTTVTLPIPEHSTVVTTVSATDPDAGTTLTYSIAGGPDAAKFAINSTTGLLSFITAPTLANPTDSDHNNSYVVQVASSDGTLTSDPQTITVNVTNASTQKVAGDFNHDGNADILWQNDNSAVAIWYMNGNGFAGGGPNLPFPGAGWHATAAADFDGDGKADILWQNDSGAPALWLMGNAGATAFSGSLPNSGPSWHVIATGDFNGDGKADILWQNDNSLASIWYMNGTSIAGFGPNLPNPGAGWHAKAAADFNNDGKADILWQNDNGAVALWLMGSGGVASFSGPLPNLGTAWHVIGAGDFNGDGKADILFQNDSGAAAIWFMDGGNLAAVGPNLPNPGSNWQEQAVEDINGDGKADIVWHSNDNLTSVWLMGATGIAGVLPPLPNTGAGWHVV